MADVEYWIQIENRRWDVSPANLDRVTGLSIKALEQHEGQPALRRPRKDNGNGIEEAPR